MRPIRLASLAVLAAALGAAAQEPTPEQSALSLLLKAEKLRAEAEDRQKTADPLVKENGEKVQTSKDQYDAEYPNMTPQAKQALAPYYSDMMIKWGQTVDFWNGAVAAYGNQTTQGTGSYHLKQGWDRYAEGKWLEAQQSATSAGTKFGESRDKFYNAGERSKQAGTAATALWHQMIWWGYAGPIRW